MRGNFKITIDKKVTEQGIVETCLNYVSAGLDYKILLFFYAFAQHWHYDKLIYYVNLIEKEIKKQNE
jgi:hypothetical protein